MSRTLSTRSPAALAVDPRSLRSLRSLALSPAVAALGLCAPAIAQAPQQTTFSIDYRGPTISSFWEGDILTPFAMPPVPALPGAPPTIQFTASSLGLSICSHAPGDRGCVELDALSYGNDVELGGEDDPPEAMPPVPHHRLWFSVDEFAVGANTNPCSPSSSVNVATEGDSGAREASADVFIDLRLASAPFYPPSPCPFCPATPCPVPLACFTGNGWGVDGDGHFSLSCARYAGLGLVEPNASSMCPCAAWPCSTCAAPGDDVDALDIDGPVGNIVYFSLDSLLFDPLLKRPNTGSAAAQNALLGGGEVLKADTLTATYSVYATTSQLGLDLFGPGPTLGSDDLDALVLRDHKAAVGATPDEHDGVFQPSLRPYDWTLANPLVRKDMLLFSVRRGSRIVGHSILGQTDSLLGLPIEPGDILTTPLKVNWTDPSTGCAYTPLSPYPAILIPAEALGLKTDRANGILGDEYGDDLDALDTSLVFFDLNGNGNEDMYDVLDGISQDCNRNGQPDEYDVAGGGSVDTNTNGIPDECESLPGSYCTSGTSANGCIAVITGSGVPSASEASCFQLQVAQVDGLRQGLIFYGMPAAAIPYGPFSFQCVASPLQRSATQNSGGTGGLCDGTLTVDWNALHASLGPAYSAGTVVYAQGWFRDPSVAPKFACMSNGFAFTLGP